MGGQNCVGRTGFRRDFCGDNNPYLTSPGSNNLTLASCATFRPDPYTVRTELANAPAFTQLVWRSSVSAGQCCESPMTVASADRPRNIVGDVARESLEGSRNASVMRSTRSRAFLPQIAREYPQEDVHGSVSSHNRSCRDRSPIRHNRNPQ